MDVLLVVEDEKLIRRGLCVMAKRSGVPIGEILECSNGEEAMRILEERPVDVMLTDIRMPKMDGIELVHRLETLKRKPLVVAVSGYNEFDYAVEMLRGGVRDYLLKPVEREKLCGILESLEQELQKKKQARLKQKNLDYRRLSEWIRGGSEGLFREELPDQYREYPLFDRYLVTAECSGSEQSYETDDMLVLGNVEGMKLCILSRDADEGSGRKEKAAVRRGISGYHQGMKELQTAYREAVYAYQYAFLIDKMEYTFAQASQRMGRGLNGEDETEAFCDKLIQKLGTSHAEDTFSYLDHFFRNMSLGAYRPDAVQTAVRVFWDKLVETYQGVIPVPPKTYEWYSRPFLQPDLASYQKDCMDWLRQYSDRLTGQMDDCINRQKIQAALDYIRENYEKDLSMAVVSNYISMNYTLFSCVFKKQTGKKFVDYVKELRIEEARRLLETTELKVIEISKRVGYDNEKHFMKLFRKECGISPTEYRKIHSFQRAVGDNGARDEGETIV